MERHGISGTLAVVLAFNGANLGFQIGRIVGKNLEHADQRVIEIQATNQQIGEQLLAQYPRLSGLTVNDNEHNYQFMSAQEGSQTESCIGSYEITDKTAHLLGYLTCSTVQPVVQNP